MERAARNIVDENGVLLYHENLEFGLNGFWVEAKDLQVGDVFLGANGELSTLTNIVRVEQSGGIAVFNFTVEGNHNYFILAKEYEYGQTCVLVHNAGKWYHGTSQESANDILTHGLHKDHMTDVINKKTNLGLYVTDDISMAQDFARLKGNGDGAILEFLDNDIGDLLIGDGTKIREAVIPFDNFNQVKPSMIKRYIE